MVDRETNINVELQVTLEETFIYADTVAAGKTTIVNLEESFAVQDSVGRPTSFSRSNAETFDWGTDGLSRQSSFSRTNSETFAVADSSSRSAQYYRSLGETYAVDDTIVSVKTFLRTPTETFVYADDIYVTKAGSYVRTCSETFSLSDSVARKWYKMSQAPVFINARSLSNIPLVGKIQDPVPRAAVKQSVSGIQNSTDYFNVVNIGR